MSNTWYYRFAFRVEGRDDVPTEFRSVYDRLRSSGPTVFGLFTPSIEESDFLVSRWVPPRLVLVFPESLALLSLDTRSDQVRSFELCRDDFLGYGFAEFLLNCWFTLYPGDSPDGRMQIRFPSRATHYYVELARFLLDWSDREDQAARDSLQSSPLISGLPAKFASFLEAHPELGPASEFFFQPAMQPSDRRQKGRANLLLTISSRGIVALADQYRGERSEYGVEMTYFPLKRVSSTDWIESTNGHEAAVHIFLQGMKVHSHVSWPVFPGLKPYALRWVKAVEGAVAALPPEHTHPEGLVEHHDKENSEPNSLPNGDGNHARRRMD